MQKNKNLPTQEETKELEKLYGEYPNYNKSIDSDAQRLKWLYSQIDGGQFYFRNIASI